MASPNASVTAGLKALNQGDYQQAIAELQAVCQTVNDREAIIKAQMGLVVAYKHINEVSRAIALCEILTQNRHPQIKAWAVRYIQQLQPPQSDSTDVIVDHSSTLAPRVSDEKEHTSPPSATSRIWRQTGRLKKLQSLPKVNLLPLWLLQAGTVVALFWLICQILRWGMRITNNVLVYLPLLEPIQLFYRDPTQFVIFTLALLMCLSPWLLDALLKQSDNLQPLSFETLATHSPEASRLIQRYYQQRGWRSPQLKLLPVEVPLALTYGNLPRNARIVVTQGLLEQLSANEVATIYATQLGFIAHRDFAVMSLVTIVTQILYIVYWQGSQLGDKYNSIVRMIAGAITSFAYVLWFLLGIPAFWLSQLRIYYSDRFATETTGNPNGLARALLKITQSISVDIQQQEYTSALLESYTLLAPISHHQAISLIATDNIERVLAWDLNPDHYWLTLNHTHPLIGDRFNRLMQIAKNWRLEPEIILSAPQKTSTGTRRLLLQGAPYFGAAFGLAFGCFTWLIGGIAIWLRIPQLAWMYGDWALIIGCVPIGFSVGTFIRINYFFPDIQSSKLNSDFDIAAFLANPLALPVDSHPVRLQGRLLGRRGIRNWLGQDLILQTKRGLVKLHRQSAKIQAAIGNDTVVTGWYRRGATLWLDIDTWRTQTTSDRNEHPIWSTILACIAAVCGVYIIVRGGA